MVPCRGNGMCKGPEGWETWLRRVVPHGLRALGGRAEGRGEIDLEKQAGQALKSLTGQAKGLGLYLKSNGEPLKVLELVTNMIKSADVGGFINAHTSGGHGRAGSPPGIHGVYSSRLRREERGQEDLAYEGLECLKSMFYRG